MGDSKVTKRCAKCGAVMHNVSVARKYCDFCRFGYATNDPVLPLVHPKYTGPTLQEIMREATKEGLQYAEYRLVAFLNEVIDMFVQAITEDFL